LSSAAFPTRRRLRAGRAALLLLEAPRALLEASALLPTWPLLRSAPSGDGHPVLVLPGYGADDASTRLLRRYLRDRGYHAHGWRQGRNLGLGADGVAGVPLRRLAALADRHGRKLSLVGWSLGGVYARELAKLSPALVRQVITLGSPFGGRARGRDIGDWLHEKVFGELAPIAARSRPSPLHAPPPVPSTAIYSRTDGIAHWRACREPEGPLTDNIEIVGSHFGLGFHPGALFAIADRLALPQDGWKPFDRDGLRGAFFR
jgi:pimeloyl-ACP methyl ester carboxylesterase